MNLNGIVRSLVILSLMVMALSGCEKEPDPIRLGTNIWPGYEPLYLARAKGMLDSNRVRLVGYPSASEVIRAFRNHSLDAASLTLDEVITLLDQKVPVKIVLVHDVSDGADMIMARPGVEGMADLKGRTVGVESSALGAYVLTRALQINKLDLSELQVKHMDVNQHESAYRRGEIDAAVSFEPFSTRLQQMGARKIFSSHELPGEIVDVLVVHEEVLEDHLEDLHHLHNSWFEALAYLKQEPEQSASIMSKRLQISEQEVLQSYQGILLPDEAENLAMLDGAQARLLASLEKLGTVMKRNGLIKNDISYRGILAADAFER